MRFEVGDLVTTLDYIYHRGVVIRLVHYGQGVVVCWLTTEPKFQTYKCDPDLLKKMYDD